MYFTITFMDAAYPRGLLISFITAVTHHLPSSHLPIPHPSSFLSHIALLLSILCSAHPPPPFAVPPIKSPFSGVTVPFCLVALASFVLWLSRFHILASINLLFLLPVVLLSSIFLSHRYPLCPSLLVSFCMLFRPLHLWISTHI